MTSTNDARPQPKIGAEQILLAVLIVVAALMYLPTFRFLWGKWMDEAQYSLGILAPLISVGFAWTKWPAAARLKRSPSAWGLVLVVMGVLIHLASVVLDVKGPSGASIIVCLVGCCLYFHGPALVKLLWFPLAYLVFMIPIPGGALDKVSFPMQVLATKSTAVMLSAIGLDVARNGISISIDGVSYEVAPACSGMSSLVALVGVTAVFAYVVRLRPLFRWVLFAFALPIALAANALRIATIGLVGYQWGQETALGLYHTWASPLLFLIAILILFLVNWILEKIDARLAGGKPSEPLSDEVGIADDGCPKTPRVRANYITAIVLFAIAMAVTVWADHRPPVATAPANLKAIPGVIGQWRQVGPDDAQPKDVLSGWMVTADNFLERRYMNPEGETLTLIVVFKARDRRNWHLSEMCYSGSGYEVKQSKVDMPYAGGVQAVKLYADDQKGGTQVAIYWFAAGRHTEGNFFKQQMSMALARLQPSDEAGWAFIRVNCPVMSTEKETTESIRDFVKSASDPLLRALAGAAERKAEPGG